MTKHKDEQTIFIINNTLIKKTLDAICPVDNLELQSEFNHINKCEQELKTESYNLSQQSKGVRYI